MNKLDVLQKVQMIVMIGLFSILGLYSAYFLKNQTYLEAEEKIVESLKKNDDYKLGKNINLKNDDLKDLIEINIKDDECIGDGTIKDTIFGRKYKVRLKCNKYKTFSLQKY